MFSSGREGIVVSISTTSDDTGTLLHCDASTASSRHRSGGDNDDANQSSDAESQLFNDDLTNTSKYYHNVNFILKVMLIN